MPLSADLNAALGMIDPVQTVPRVYQLILKVGIERSCLDADLLRKAHNSCLFFSDCRPPKGSEYRRVAEGFRSLKDYMDRLTSENERTEICSRLKGILQQAIELSDVSQSRLRASGEKSSILLDRCTIDYKGPYRSRGHEQAVAAFVK
jgi:hypothetical protein